MLTNMLGGGGLGGVAAGACRRTALALRDGCIALTILVAGSLLAVGDAPVSALEAIRTAAGLSTDVPETALRQLMFAMLVVGCLQSATVVAFVSLVARTAWAAGSRFLRVLSAGRPAVSAEVGHAG